MLPFLAKLYIFFSFSSLLAVCHQSRLSLKSSCRYVMPFIVFYFSEVLEVKLRPRTLLSSSSTIERQPSLHTFSLCDSGWSWTGHLPVSGSWVLGLQQCATTPGVVSVIVVAALHPIDSVTWDPLQLSCCLIWMLSIQSNEDLESKAAQQGLTYICVLALLFLWVSSFSFFKLICILYVLVFCLHVCLMEVLDPLGLEL